MTTPGFTGKILRVNLTARQISSIDMSKYEAYGAGCGIATAIFWDLCVAPGNWDLQDAFDHRNIVTLMSGPLAGTLIPFAGRTSVSDMYLDDKGVEQWKTAFYTFEGWNTKTGFPKRNTLEELGLKNVADWLQALNKLGAS